MMHNQPPTTLVFYEAFYEPRLTSFAASCSLLVFLSLDLILVTDSRTS